MNSPLFCPKCMSAHLQLQEDSKFRHLCDDCGSYWIIVDVIELAASRQDGIESVTVKIDIPKDKGVSL